MRLLFVLIAVFSTQALSSDDCLEKKRLILKQALEYRYTYCMDFILDTYCTTMTDYFKDTCQIKAEEVCLQNLEEYKDEFIKKLNKYSCV